MSSAMLGDSSRVVTINYCVTFWRLSTQNKISNRKQHERRKHERCDPIELWVKNELARGLGRICNIKPFANSHSQLEAVSTVLISCDIYLGTVIIPNRTFLVLFGGISGESGRAIGIFARLRLAKIYEPGSTKLT